MTPAKTHSSRRLTVRDVPPDLLETLRDEARRRGWSLNRTVLEALRRGTGLTRPGQGHRYHDLDDLSGQWTTDEADAFDDFVHQLRAPDPGMWP